jgi:hypothetical protein
MMKLNGDRIGLIGLGVVVTALAVKDFWPHGAPPPGATGPAGSNGTNGTNGANGSNGNRGQRGENGAAGKTGATGKQGPIGKTGPAGAQGPAGPAGPRGLRGAPGQTFESTLLQSDSIYLRAGAQTTVTLKDPNGITGFGGINVGDGDPAAMRLDGLQSHANSLGVVDAITATYTNTGSSPERVRLQAMGFSERPPFVPASASGRRSCPSRGIR